MELRLSLARDLIERIPELQASEIEKHGGKKFVVARQEFLARLLILSYSCRFRHQRESGADFFGSRFLAAGLHRPHNYAPLLLPFYEFDTSNKGYSRAQRIGKAYRLRPHLFQAVAEVFASNEPARIHNVDDEGRWHHTPAEFLQGLKLGGPYRGEPQLVLPPVLPVTVGQVDHAIARVDEWIRQYGATGALDLAKEQGLTLIEARCMLVVVRKWVISLGGMPNFFALQGNGRMKPREGPPHMISLPKRVRRLLYENTDAVDFDLVSCHLAVFLSLGQHYALETDCVESYINTRAAWHARFAAVGKLPADTCFKSLVSSFFTGGSLSPSLLTASGQTYGRAALRLLARDERAVALRNEIVKGMKWLLRHAATWETIDGQKTLVNAVGCHFQPEGKRGQAGKAYSHYLTGYEAWSIRQIASKMIGLQSIVYDGAICAPQDAGPLEDHLLQESTKALGFPLRLKLKQESLGTPLSY